LLLLIILVLLPAAGALCAALQRARHRAAAAEAALGRLERSEQRLQTLIEHAGEVLLVLDAAARVRWVNPSFERTWGIAAAQIFGVDFLTGIHVDDLFAVRGLLDALCAEPGARRDAEFRRASRRGWRTVEARFTNLLDDSNVGGIVANARDVTARHTAELALEHAREEAERANRSKSEFLSRTSHELRMPLNALLGFAQLLELDTLNPGEQEMVEYILKAGQHLLDLINEVVEIARIEAGGMEFSLEPVSIAQLLRESVELVAPLTRQRHVIPAVARRQDATVLADAHRLKQVFLNLLSNAVKYNRIGGSVSVDWWPLPGNRLRVCVTDTGAGIAPEKLGRLFTPFDRLGAEESGVEGSGLGLALSKRLLTGMGGAISVESTPGRGSSFRVDLALAEEATLRAAPEVPVRPPAAQLDGSGREFIVLYVEDNLSNLRLIERLLAVSPGMRLMPAMQGGLGVELAREHAPDLILLDLNLPDLSGMEVLRRLRDDPGTAHVPVVVISADATETRIAELSGSGVQAYLTKPLDVGRFRRLLAELHGAAVAV
jgi:PAS domain S-box-containing protein